MMLLGTVTNESSGPEVGPVRQAQMGDLCLREGRAEGVRVKRRQEASSCRIW